MTDERRWSPPHYQYKDLDKVSHGQNEQIPGSLAISVCRPTKCELLSHADPKRKGYHLPEGMPIDPRAEFLARLENLAGAVGLLASSWPEFRDYDDSDWNPDDDYSFTYEDGSIDGACLFPMSLDEYAAELWAKVAEFTYKEGDLVYASYWTGGGFSYVVGIIQQPDFESGDYVTIEPLYMCGDPDMCNPLDGAYEVKKVTL